MNCTIRRRTSMLAPSRQVQQDHTCLVAIAENYALMAFSAFCSSRSNTSKLGGSVMNMGRIVA